MSLIRRKEPGEAWETADDSGGGGFEAGSSRALFIGSAQAGVAAGDSAVVEWTLDTDVGADVEVADGDATIIRFLTAGTYQVMVFVGVNSSGNPGTPMREVQVSIMDPAFVFSVDPYLGTSEDGAANIQAVSPIGVASEGQEITVEVYASRGDEQGVWNLEDNPNRMHVVRLA